MVCCAIQSSLDVHGEGGHTSVYFNKKVLSDITSPKEQYKTKTHPAHLNLTGNHINFCSPAKVASGVQ